VPASTLRLGPLGSDSSSTWLRRNGSDSLDLVPHHVRKKRVKLRRDKTAERLLVQRLKPPRTDHNAQSTRTYEGFIYFYYHHRAHGALRWATPISILKDNVPKEHT
jgi:hypothetical protein